MFFRNNHFSTMLKLQGSIYLLLTDVGFGNMPNVVWEKLINVRRPVDSVSALFLSRDDSCSTAVFALHR